MKSLFIKRFSKKEEKLSFQKTFNLNYPLELEDNEEIVPKQEEQAPNGFYRITIGGITYDLEVARRYSESRSISDIQF
jgi:hypothetical protein